LVFSDRIPIGYSTTAKDPRIQDPDLRYIWNETAERLVETLRGHLLNVVAIAIASEAFHLFDMLGGKIITKKEKKNDEVPRLKLLRGQGLTPKIENLIKLLGRDSSSIWYDEVDGETQGIRMLKLANKCGIPPAELISSTSKLFLLVKLQSGYGGKQWAVIANAWLLLNNAKDLQSKINFIDHIYDLQHNSGSVFSKIKEYFIFDPSRAWLPVALEYKLNLKNIYQIIPLATPELQRFLYAYIYDKWDIASDTFTAEQRKQVLKDSPMNPNNNIYTSFYNDEYDVFFDSYNSLRTNDKIQLIRNLNYSKISTKHIKKLEIIINDFINNKLYKTIPVKTFEEIYDDKFLGELFIRDFFMRKVPGKDDFVLDSSSHLSDKIIQHLGSIIYNSEVLEYIKSICRNNPDKIKYWIDEVLPSRGVNISQKFKEMITNINTK